MKKSMFLAAMAIAVASMTSCNNGTPNANLKSDVDSVSYAIGMAQTQGLKDYLVMQLGVDTTYMDSFIKGLNDGVNAGESKKKAAYYAGIQIGQQISNQMIKGINYQLFGEDSTQTISMNNFMAGFVTGTTGKKGLMTMEEAQENAQRLMQQIKAREMEKIYGDNKKAGEEFMAANATKEGVQTLPSGVQYKVLKEGKGATPESSSTVTMHYEGRLINDSVFDSSYKRNQPYTVRCDQNIKGFTEALTNMKEGDIWEVYIPQELAYGERQAGAMVKPFSALIFKIELIEVKK
jgi:FKBP-type peptidyl-prolyl cis-trans isomerase FklB